MTLALNTTMKTTLPTLQSRSISTNIYGFDRADLNAAVQLIERMSGDRGRSNSLMLIGAELFAVAAGGLLIHLAATYNIIVRWLDAPMTTFGILFSLSISIFLLLRSNRRTEVVSKDLKNKGYAVIQDSFGDWWLLQTRDGTAERIILRN